MNELPKTIRIIDEIPKTVDAHCWSEEARTRRFEFKRSKLEIASAIVSVGAAITSLIGAGIALAQVYLR